MKEKIRDWCSDNFADRLAARWATQWLCTFFATTSAFETIKGLTDMHSDFGGNEFYCTHKAILAGLCAHAAQSYAESAPFMAQETESDWTVGGIMQVIEPVIMAARLEGITNARKKLVALIKSGNS